MLPYSKDEDFVILSAFGFFLLGLGLMTSEIFLELIGDDFAAFPLGIILAVVISGFVLFNLDIFVQFLHHHAKSNFVRKFLKSQLMKIALRKKNKLLRREEKQTKAEAFKYRRDQELIELNQFLLNASPDQISSKLEEIKNNKTSNDAGQLSIYEEKE